MKLSVIIPCYNVEKFVQKCAESILMQKEFDFEIILINDGSQDNTLQIVEKLANSDSRIRIINRENQGLSAARNIGVERAKGEYIMFVDADDWLEPNTMQIIAQKFKQEDLFCFSYNKVFKNRTIARDLKINGTFDATFIQRRIVGLSSEELRDPSQADSLATAWGKIYKAEIIKKNKIEFVDTKIIGTEDALFNIQYLEYATKVSVLNLPLYNYHKANQLSLTKLYKPYLFHQWKALFNKIAEITNKKDKQIKIALNNRVALSIIGLGINETYSEIPLWAKVKKISVILHDDLYIKAYQNLDFNYFPLHWKLFFYLARSKNALGVLFLSQLMCFLSNKLIKITSFINQYFSNNETSQNSSNIYGTQ